MGNAWSRGRTSLALSTLDPGNAGERWEMGGREAGEAWHFPPYTQANRVKDGIRVVERWEKLGTSHLIPRQTG